MTNHYGCSRNSSYKLNPPPSIRRWSHHHYLKQDRISRFLTWGPGFIHFSYLQYIASPTFRLSHPYVPLCVYTTLSLISLCLLAYLLLLLRRLLGFALLLLLPPPSRFDSIPFHPSVSPVVVVLSLPLPLAQASLSIHSMHARIIIPMIISPRFPFCPSYFHCSILVIADESVLWWMRPQTWRIWISDNLSLDYKMLLRLLLPLGCVYFVIGQDLSPPLPPQASAVQIVNPPTALFSVSEFIMARCKQAAARYSAEWKVEILCDHISFHRKN